MRADGPAATAEITLTPCISLNEEKAGTVASLMTVGNSPGPAKPPHLRITATLKPDRDNPVAAKCKSRFIGELKIDPPQVECFVVSLRFVFSL